jgi:hypothetical protein
MGLTESTMSRATEFDALQIVLTNWTPPKVNRGNGHGTLDAAGGMSSSR